MDMLDVSFVDKVNTITGALVVIASYIFGEHWTLFGAFLLLNVLDYFTGLTKSKILKNESSSAGLKGILKKFGYWCLLVVAFIMSPILNEIGAAIGIDIKIFTPFIGYMVLAMLIVNEFRSVLENLVECGINVPTVLVKGLAVFEKKVNDAQDFMFDGHIDVDKKSDSKYSVKLDTPVGELEKRDTVTLKIRTISDDED